MHPPFCCRANHMQCNVIKEEEEEEEEEEALPSFFAIEIAQYATSIDDSEPSTIPVSLRIL
jgi:hypothetical protein